jgi:hypothetical protein
MGNHPAPEFGQSPSDDCREKPMTEQNTTRRSAETAPTPASPFLSACAEGFAQKQRLPQ